MHPMDALRAAGTLVARNPSCTVVLAVRHFAHMFTTNVWDLYAQFQLIQDNGADLRRLYIHCAGTKIVKQMVVEKPLKFSAHTYCEYLDSMYDAPLTLDPLASDVAEYVHASANETDVRMAALYRKDIHAEAGRSDISRKDLPENDLTARRTFQRAIIPTGKNAIRLNPDSCDKCLKTKVMVHA